MAKRGLKSAQSSSEKAKRVKAVARKRVGPPKPTRLIDEKGVRDEAKHKKRWDEVLTDL